MSAFLCESFAEIHGKEYKHEKEDCFACFILKEIRDCKLDCAECGFCYDEECLNATIFNEGNDA